MEGNTIMSYQYQMICLANSRKLSGRCVAGKITDGQKKGTWIRPVGTSQTHEITERDRGYANGASAQKLDIIKVTYRSQQVPSFQCENHVIDDAVYWEKTGEVALADLVQWVDTPNALWENVDSSYSGTNDRVPDNLLTQPRQTLYLIRPENVRVTVAAEGAAFGDAKRNVRATFTYNRIQYALMITDPLVEQYYKGLGDGKYHPDNISYFTISLGETHKGFAYKLIAAVF